MRRCVRGWRTWRERSGMTCPRETVESAELLLAYSTGKLNSERAAAGEQHIGICPVCGEFVARQQAVSKALGAWQAPAVSADFDRRLYQRIEKEVSWWDLLIR